MTGSNDAAKKEHCDFCFDVLKTKLEGGDVNKIQPSFADEEYPLFVTWKTESARHGEELRGCIGNFSPMRLHSGLKEYALISALNDSRFQPIAMDEMNRLICSVSLLTDFEPAASWKDWEIGRHGIRISFNDGSKYSATYLPEVAKEQRWSHSETLESLIRKAGFRGSITPTLLDTLDVTRYQSSKAHCSYKEYQLRAAAKEN